MKTAKWLDEHFEEAIIIFLLAVISVVELMQVVCRNVPGIPALSWAEEMARYAWIVTVFISLPFTIRTNTTLKVTALVEAFPWKVTNIITIVVDLITAVALGILAWTSTTVIGQVLEGGSTSPAMQIPMWIMYVIIFIGFAGGTLRSLQMCYIHIKNINVPPVNSVEAAAADELAAADIAEEIATNDGKEEPIVDEALNTAWTDNGRGEA
jgi:TRAP-type C4-dicarboxylate transport system permease small subunit